MQKRFWNWKDDDLTFSLNRWLLGVLDFGLYRGFEFSPTSNMLLTLVHTSTGLAQVKKDLTTSSKVGVILSRQGTLVQEDSAIELPVEAAHPTLPRIDIVVFSHKYVDLVGGEPATYSIVKGTPNASPVAPSVLDISTDIKIGEILIPAAVTSLDATGVVYTRSATPFLAGDTRIYSELLTSLSVINDKLNAQVLLDYSTDVANSISTDAGITVKFQSEKVATVAAYDIVTGLFTAPSTGYYEVTTNLNARATVITADTFISVFLQKNGAGSILNPSWGMLYAASGVNKYSPLGLSRIVQLNAGDTISVIYSQASSGSLTTSNVTGNLTIQKIK